MSSLHRIILNILHRNTLHYTALHCIALHCIVYCAEHTKNNKQDWMVSETKKMLTFKREIGREKQADNWSEFYYIHKYKKVHHNSSPTIKSSN